MKLTPAQARGIDRGRATAWAGARETGVPGDTMAALERRGLAEVRHDGRRCLYRLTAEGNALRVDRAIEVATEPVEHVPVRTRCTHCGDVQEDSTDGGSCGRCGLTVEAVAA